MELELKQSQEHYQTLVENSPVGILVHQRGIIEYANPMALKLLGAEAAKEIIGKPIDSFVHPDYKSMVTGRLYNMEKHGKQPLSIHVKFVRLDGKEIDVEIKRMIVQFNGSPAIQKVFWDNTDKKKEEDLIRYRAYYDPLTDLPNFHKFHADYAEEVNKDRPFTMMYIELSGLKQINDLHGHQPGDIALMKAAARLAGITGIEGIAYRLVGNKFIFVLPGKKQKDEWRKLAECIVKVVQLPIYISGTTVQVLPTIGVVFYPDHGLEMDMLLNHGFMAVKFAKKTNTRYKLYDD